MFEEKRPTAVSVVGWVWIVLGALAIPTGALYLTVSLFQPDTGFMPLWYSVLLGAVQCGMGVAGVVCGVAYLRMTPWSRWALETLCWVLLALIVSSAVSVFFVGGGGFGWYFGLIGLGFSAMYSIPVVLMIRSLRSAKVREAMGAPA